jgi:hypothetical protein
MPRSLSGAVTAIVSLTCLVIGLAAIDGRVREQLAWLLNGGGPSREMVSAGSKVESLVAVFAAAVRDQSMEHAALVIFALAALVLVLFMLRT